MVYTRGDIGVYVTLTLFGAGIGLIVGAFVAYEYERRKKFIDELEETYEEDQDVELQDENVPAEKTAHVKISSVVDGKEPSSNSSGDTDSAVRSDLRDGGAEPESIGIGGGSTRSGSRSGRINYQGISERGNPTTKHSGEKSPETPSEEEIWSGSSEHSRFRELVEDFELTAIQIEMYETGTVDIDELESIAQLNIEHQDDEDDWVRPDLDEFVQFKGTDSRWAILDSTEVQGHLAIKKNPVRLGVRLDSSLVRITKDNAYVNMGINSVLFEPGLIDYLVLLLEALQVGNFVYLLDRFEEKLYTVELIVPKEPPPKKKSSSSRKKEEGDE